ncbi:hypothetical protein COV20_00290 [Candidatus Woesearchaeota archaeon CG10_big_fil_rev_8_21_14_0_10_45_16]|nr:MAG: hypothetical protein COV20_00290 [Candidatus Woesearchaeota archaeon CG10_big_fil_rev_8_21_14_0_10_45_16]
MYHASVSYNTAPVGGSRLEYIAHSVNAPSYNASSTTITPSYAHSLFRPSISSFTYRNEEPVSHAYRADTVTYHLFNTKPEYHFQPDNFLKPGKHGIFVGKAEEIREHIEDAFFKVMNKPFPSDVKITVCEEKEFRKIAPSSGVVGLSINRSQHGLLSEIFVLNDYLGRVMLTIGHELGHVLTSPLENQQDEEAKAYAFSFAWMDVIKEHDIAGLGDALVSENPAHNGLHDVAYSFVSRLLKSGKDAWEVYLELIHGDNNIKHTLF